MKLFVPIKVIHRLKTFESKVFLAIALSSVAIGTLLIFGLYSRASTSTKDDFFERYGVLNELIGKVIVEFERSSEALLLNALYVVREKDSHHGLLSTEKLKELASQTSVTHLFVVDRKGKFVRSTNEDPELIPNLFSFCNEYRAIYGTKNSEATPIIPPTPEVAPYKFLTISNANGDRLLHAGLRIDFIHKMLKQTIGEDPNILNLELFSPDGTGLGQFSSGAIPYSRTKDDTVPGTHPGLRRSSEGYVISTWVDSSHTDCCQCKTSGNVSRDGKYRYLVRATVSQRPLSSALAKLLVWYSIAEIVSIIFSVAFARIWARRLVARLRSTASQIGDISGSLADKTSISVEGSDEIAQVAVAFNHLLERLRHAQHRLVELERHRSRADLARQVAHDIRSPLTVLRILNEETSRTRTETDLVRSAIMRINEIADDLLKQPESLPLEAEETAAIDVDAGELPSIISSVVSEKLTEFLPRRSVAIHFEVDSIPAAKVRLDVPTLRRILSNIINNAVEACTVDAEIQILLRSDPDYLVIEVRDNGCGIPADVLRKLGQPGNTSGKKAGSGLGLFHAMKSLKAWGGKFDISSASPSRTVVQIHLARVRRVT